MGCCGNRGKRSVKAQVVTGGATRGMRVQGSTALPTPRTNRNITQPRVSSVKPQRRCPKCSWPMNIVRIPNKANGIFNQLYACMNKKCLHRMN
jgi:hypothetical protein